jgi:N-acetylmuramoyl-L-alanine amidase
LPDLAGRLANWIEEAAMIAQRVVHMLAGLCLAGCAAGPVADVPAGSAPPPADGASAPAPAALVIDRLPEDYPHGGYPRRAEDIDLIVIHTIGGAICKDGAPWFTPAEGSAVFWRDWFLGETGKSIHYVVGRSGDVAQQRPELRTAGHVSFGGIMARVNQRSIGIELVNRGDGLDPFPQAQIEAVTALTADIASRYGLPPGALTTHAALDDRMQPDCGGAPLRRTVDPGPLFPLEDVRRAAWAPALP